MSIDELKAQQPPAPGSLYSSDYVVGQDNISPIGLDIHNPVFLISSFTIVAFVLFTLSQPDLAAVYFNDLRIWLTTTLDWFFMGAMNSYLLFCVFLVLSPLGRIRIGGPNARPR
ncbi:MAG: BCCT family transporter, partial [Gammaproteobacteria bacterium]|nr:BCCT family transporter [Gammaproteobacteria bacterium]